MAATVAASLPVVSIGPSNLIPTILAFGALFSTAFSSSYRVRVMVMVMVRARVRARARVMVMVEVGVRAPVPPHSSSVDQHHPTPASSRLLWRTCPSATKWN